MVLDPIAGELQDPQDVVVEGDIIRDLSMKPLQMSGAAEVIDLAGRTLMPGLIDAHVHVMAVTANLAQLSRIPPTLVAAQAKSILKAMLLRGFTTVRDAGGAEWGLAEAVRLNYFKGPRLFVSGLALAQSGGQGDFRTREETVIGCPCCHSLRSISRVVDGVDAVRTATREELRKGATQIKVMAGGGIASGVPVDRAHYSREEFVAIVEEAQLAGTYVMAHAYSPFSIRRAVEFGVRTIEHGNLIDTETAEFMAGRAFVVPTLAVYEGYRKHADEFGLSNKVKEGLEGLLKQGLESIDIYRKAGVKIGHGSDLEGNLHGYQLREFSLRQAVMSPSEMVASATIVNADLMQMQGKLGVIQPGAHADLLVIRGNPLKDIGLLQGEGRHLDAIMKGGVFYKNELRSSH
jgi:imidazolonepropionase-like amidohydrolase